ncbi:hypothetical protein AB3N60_04825 [Leptospira sp. WS39.C2]
MHSIKKYYIIFFILLFFIIRCKEREKAKEPESDSFYLELEKGCTKDRSNKQILDGCIEKKASMECFKYLEFLNNSNLEKIFNNSDWYSEDMQSFRYKIDNFGNFKIFQGGPDSEPIYPSGVGRIHKRNERWKYEHSCNKNFCEKLEFEINYMSCYAGYSQGYDAYILSLTLENSDWYEDDENFRKQHKEVTFIKLINHLPQITNGFISTKVPPPSN